MSKLLGIGVELNIDGSPLGSALMADFAMGPVKAMVRLWKRGAE